MLVPLASSRNSVDPSLASWSTLFLVGDRDGSDGDPKETLKNWSSIIGIVTAIVGNVLIALALNVQRYAHIRIQREKARVRRRARLALGRENSTSATKAGTSQSPSTGYGAISDGRGHARHDSALMSGRDDESHADPDSPLLNGDDSNEGTRDGKAASTYLKSPYWWLGQVLITLGEMGNFLAYGFAPASIVSPLGVVALISNCIIAPVMFKERFRVRDFWGIIIAVGGVATVVVSAKQEETKLNPHDVWDAITTLEFEVYLAVTICLIVILMWVSSRFGRQSILIDLGLVGLFGGYTALATKGVSSMLSSTLWRAFTTPVTYALLAVLLGTAVMQIRYVNKALQRFDSTQVIPVQFVLFTLCVILGSAVLYRDFEKTTATQAGQFVGGCLLTFFGVFLITSGRQHKDDTEDLLSEAEGVEETIGLRPQDGSGTYGDVHQDAVETRSRRSSHHSKSETATHNKPYINVEPAASSLQHIASRSPEADEEDSPLLQRNMWANPSPGPLASSRTMPVLPSEALMPRTDPEPPPGPTLQQHSNTQRPVTPRPGLGTSRSLSHQNYRNSTFISPSPLSSTVTRVVKDAFLRPGDTRSDMTKSSSIRRIRSSIRASLFFDDEEASLLEQSLHGEMPSDLLLGTAHGISAASTSAGGEGSSAEAVDLEDSSRRRSRSLSDTLGELFRPKRKKTDDSVTSGGGRPATMGEQHQS